MTKKVERLKLSRETVRRLTQGAAYSGTNPDSRYPCPINSFYAACPGPTIYCTE